MYQGVCIIAILWGDVSIAIAINRDTIIDNAIAIVVQAIAADLRDRGDLSGANGIERAAHTCADTSLAGSDILRAGPTRVTNHLIPFITWHG